MTNFLKIRFGYGVDMCGKLKCDIVCPAQIVVEFAADFSGKAQLFTEKSIVCAFVQLRCVWPKICIDKYCLLAMLMDECSGFGIELFKQFYGFCLLLYRTVAPHLATQ